MLPLAHMGIGSKLVNTWSKELPRWALLAGTLLPDVIDKPLYYILFAITRLNGGHLGLINNSRTVGHTAMFLLALTLLAVTRRSRVLAALALGVATHLMLDKVGFDQRDGFCQCPDFTRAHACDQRRIFIG